MPSNGDFSYVKAEALALSLPLKSVVSSPTASATTHTPVISVFTLNLDKSQLISN